MNRTTTMLYLLAGIGLALTLGSAPGVQAATPVIAIVNGGGTAVFDDPRFEGGTTQSALGVVIRSDGSATGHFECVITGVLALSVHATAGSLNGDGSVTFSGPGVVHFAGGGTFSLDPFVVNATAGGPGVGTFCLAPPTFADTPCDHETFVTGGIHIH